MARYGINILRGGHNADGNLLACFPVTTLTNAEISIAGAIFKIGDVIKNIYVDVKTAEATGATKTIDIGILSSGTAGDADGLVDGLSTATAAIVMPTRVVTTGSNTKFFASTTHGVLTCDFQAGTDVDQDEGLFMPKLHTFTGTNETQLTYTLGSATQTELVADIYVEYFRKQAA